MGKKKKKKRKRKRKKNECTRLPELSYVFCKNKKTSQVIKSERKILISEGDENPNKIYLQKDMYFRENLKSNT